MAGEEKCSVEHLSEIIFDDEDAHYKVLEVCPQGRFRKFNDEIASSPLKTVHRGYDADCGREVYWHTIKVKKVLKGDLARIQKEISVFKALRHDHLLNCIDCWSKVEEREIVFVTEMVNGSSLKNYLNKIKTTRLKIIKDWAEQILQGLVYLHEHSPAVIHRSLRCDNVYINSTKNEIKIGELGILCTCSDPLQSLTSCFEWTAPEVVDGVISSASDIYSFGMTLLEIITGKKPYTECLNEAQVCKLVSNQVKPASLDEVASAELRHIIEGCITFESSARPSARELLGLGFWKASEESDSTLIKLQSNLTSDSRQLVSKESKEEEKSVRLSEVVEKRELEREVKFLFELPNKRKYQISVRKDPKDQSQEWIQFLTKRFEDKPAIKEEHTNTLSNNPTMKTMRMDYLCESRIKEDENRKSTITFSEPNEVFHPDMMNKVVESFNSMYEAYKGSLDPYTAEDQFQETRLFIERKSLEELQHFERERLRVNKKGGKYVPQPLMNSYNLIDILNNLETIPMHWASDISEMEKDMTFKHTLNGRHEDVLSLNFSSIYNYREEMHTDFELENARFYDLLEDDNDGPAHRPLDEGDLRGDHKADYKGEPPKIRSEVFDEKEEQSTNQEDEEARRKPPFEKKPSLLLDKDKDETVESRPYLI